MNRRRIAALVAALLLVCTLLVGAFVPPATLRAVTTLPSPLLHFGGMTALVALLTLAWPRHWLLFALGVLGGSGLVELIQPAVGRGAEWSDFRANCAGLFTGLAIGLLGALLRRLAQHALTRGPLRREA